MTNRLCMLAALILPSVMLTAACDDGDDFGEESAAPLQAAPPIDDALFELGQALFFDKVLSGNHDVSCATCHHPTLGTDDDLALSRGVGGEKLGSSRTGGVIIARNAPALFNLHAYETMFWDSRVELREGELRTPAGDQLTAAMRGTLTLGVVAAQAMFPVVSREEMRGAAGNELAQLGDDDFQGVWAGLMQRLGQYPEYVDMFERAYPGTPFASMTFAHAANAIAGYEIRAFERIDSPYQRFLQGDEQAMSEEARRGHDEFFDEGCGRCHSGPLLSDFRHHNTGLVQLGPGLGHGIGGREDFGREGVTGDRRDRYAFRTTPLINIARTGPFGHAGQFASLEAFIEHYHGADRRLDQYDVREHVTDPELWGTVLNNRTVIEDGIDRAVRRIDRLDVDEIAAFIRETSAYDDSGQDAIPAKVPSGLPID